MKLLINQVRTGRLVFLKLHSTRNLIAVSCSCQLTNVTTAHAAKMVSNDLILLARRLPDLVPWALTQIEPKVVRTLNEGYGFHSITDSSARTDIYDKLGFDARRGDMAAKKATESAEDWMEWFKLLEPTQRMRGIDMAQDKLNMSMFESVDVANVGDVDAARAAGELRDGFEECCAGHKVLMLAWMARKGQRSVFHHLYKFCKKDTTLYSTKIMQIAIKFKWHNYVEHDDATERTKSKCKFLVATCAFSLATIQRHCRGQCANSDSEIWSVARFLHAPLIGTPCTVVDVLIFLTVLAQLETIVMEVFELMLVPQVSSYFKKRSNWLDLSSIFFLLVACYSFYACDSACEAMSTGTTSFRMLLFPTAASYGVVLNFFSCSVTYRSSPDVGLFITALRQIIVNNLMMKSFLKVSLFLLLVQTLFFVINTPNDPHFSGLGFDREPSPFSQNSFLSGKVPSNLLLLLLTLLHHLGC